MTGFTGTFAGTGGLTVSGSAVFGGEITRTGTITFNSTAAGNTITSNNKTLPHAVTFNGVGGEWALADALSITGNLNLTNGSFSDGGFSVTANAHFANNNNVRAVTKTGTWTLTGTGTVLAINGSNITWSDTAGAFNLTNATATARALTLSGRVINDLNVTAGTGDLTFTVISTGSINNLSFVGFTGTLINGLGQVLGNLTLDAGMTCPDSTNTVTFAGTSGTQVFTTNGVALNRALTVNNPGATVQLAGALDLGARRLTVTAGSFEDMGFAVTANTFLCNSSTARTVTKTGNWTITGNTTAAFRLDGANLTWSDSGTLTLTDASATAKTISAGDVQVGDVYVTAGTSVTTFDNWGNGSFGSVDFTGFSGELNSNDLMSVRGNLTLSATMTVASTGTWGTKFVGAAGIQEVRCNGVQHARRFEVAPPGATVRLIDDLDLGPGTFVLTSGSFDANDMDVTAFAATSFNTNVRSLDMGAGLWTITSNVTLLSGDAPWQFFDTTNLTLSALDATIKFTDATGEDIAFNGGNADYGTVWFAGAAGSVVSMQQPPGTMGIAVLKIDSPKEFRFSAGGVFDIESFVGFTGAPGDLVALSGLGQFYLNYLGAGVFESDYISVSNMVGGPSGYRWFMGDHSTNGGNCRGVAFTTPENAAFMGRI